MSQLRNQIVAEQNLNKQAKAQLEESQVKLADTERDLLSARTDCKSFRLPAETDVS